MKYILIPFFLILFPHMAYSGIDDHYADVKVKITNVGIDPIDANRTLVGIMIENLGSADLILRGIDTNFGLGRIQKKVNFLGFETTLEPPFIAVVGEATTTISPPKFWLSIPEKFSPEKYFAILLDFGPHGEVIFDVNLPPPYNQN